MIDTDALLAELFERWAGRPDVVGTCGENDDHVKNEDRDRLHDAALTLRRSRMTSPTHRRTTASIPAMATSAIRSPHR
jgi:hypothetical protein